MTTEAVPDLAPAEDSAVPESSAPNIITLSPCRCPRKQHDEDLVILHREITVPMGIAAMAVIREGNGYADVYGGLADVYLRLGIASWTFTDKDGELEPRTAENIARLLPFNDGGLEVAEAADELYSADVMRPLRKRYPKLFQTSSTESSTPPSPSSGSKRRTPSGRSSRNGTAGKPSEDRGR